MNSRPAPADELYDSAVDLKLGLRTPADVVGVAAEVVAQMPDVPESVVALAVESREIRREDLDTLLGKALGDLGFTDITDEVAVATAAQRTAAGIVDGSIGPSDGAKRIWLAMRALDVDDPQLNQFIALADDWDEHPDDRDEIENDIRAAARRVPVSPMRRTEASQPGDRARDLQDESGTTPTAATC